MINRLDLFNAAAIYESLSYLINDELNNRLSRQKDDLPLRRMLDVPDLLASRILKVFWLEQYEGPEVKFVVKLEWDGARGWNLVIANKLGERERWFTFSLIKAVLELAEREGKMSVGNDVWFVREQKPFEKNPTWHRIDPAISNVIAAMWQLGCTTYYCCSGHPNGMYITFTPGEAFPKFGKETREQIGLAQVKHQLNSQFRKINQIDPELVVLQWKGNPNTTQGFDDPIGWMTRNYTLKALEAALIDRLPDKKIAIEKLIVPGRMMFRGGYRLSEDLIAS